MSESVIDKLSNSDHGRSYANYDRPLWRRVLLNQESFVILLLIAVYVVSCVALPNYSGPTTIDFLLLNIAPFLLIAVPEALVIITGEIDLSVGSVVGLSSAALGIAVHANLGILTAMLLSLAVGIVCGTINGLLVTLLGLPSLAVTIGTLALFRGLAVGLLGTNAYSTFPTFWTNLAGGDVIPGAIPAVTVLVVVLIAIFAILLHFTPFGRGIFAIGLSKDAALFSGIRVGRTKLLLFIFTGFVSAIAGIYLTLQTTTAVSSNGLGLELDVIAPVLLGGVSVFGGRGAVPGIIGGVLLIGLIQSALSFAGLNSDGVTVVTGALLIASVISTTILAWARRRKPAARSRTTGA